MTTTSKGLRKLLVGLLSVASALFALPRSAAAQVAQCKNVVVVADSNCGACVSVNNSEPTLHCTESPPCPYQGVGPHVVTLTCTDQYGNPAGSCVGTVSVVDQTAPLIMCPANQTQMCGAPSTATTTATDNCGAALVTCTPQAGPGGTITQNCTAQDASGNSSSCSYTITDAPPTVTVTPKTQPIVLWPPDHKYRQVTLSDCVASVVSSCAGPLDISQYGVITRVESDEYEEDSLYHQELGDGNTCRDIVINGSASVLLRAERDAKGDGREYTIYFTVGDPQGGSTPGTCTVYVPRDQCSDTKDHGAHGDQGERGDHGDRGDRDQHGDRDDHRHQEKVCQQSQGVRQACHYCEGEACAGCAPHNPMCNF